MDSSRKSNLSTTFWIPQGRVLQGNNLGYKEGRQNLTIIKAPMPPRIKIRIIDPSLALQSCENISNLTFGGYLADFTPVPFARYSCFLLLCRWLVWVQGSCFSLVRFMVSSGAKKWLLTVGKLVTMQIPAYMHLVHALYHIANLSFCPSSYIFISVANIWILQYALYIDDFNFSDSIDVNEKCIFLQGQNDYVLFVLNNSVDLRGNKVTINCVGPSSTIVGFSYGLAAKTQESSLRLEFFTTNSPHRVDSPPSEFLLIPSDVFMFLWPTYVGFFCCKRNFILLLHSLTN